MKPLNQIQWNREIWKTPKWLDWAIGSALVVADILVWWLILKPR